MNTDETIARAQEKLTSSAAKKFGAAFGSVLAVVVLFWLLVQSRGIFNAVVYAFVFILCATLFPILISLFGNAVPGAPSIGKLHLTLGALAFDHHFLVQRDHKWEWCPGERYEDGLRVWVDDDWHHVDGEENLSVLGWRPFGILRYKDKETWSEHRVDTKGESLRGATAADGGANRTDERAGWELSEPEPVSGVDGAWLLDLKRIYSRGIEKIGDIELIETAEEIIERKQVESTSLSGWRPFIETGSGLLLGVITGYAYIMLS